MSSILDYDGNYEKEINDAKGEDEDKDHSPDPKAERSNKRTRKQHVIPFPAEFFLRQNFPLFFSPEEPIVPAPNSTNQVHHSS